MDFDLVKEMDELSNYVKEKSKLLERASGKLSYLEDQYQWLEYWHKTSTNKLNYLRDNYPDIYKELEGIK